MAGVRCRARCYSVSKSGFTSTRARMKMRRLLTMTDSGIKPAMQDAVNILTREMKGRVPVDTGDLKDNITGFVAKNGMRGEVGLRGKKARSRGFYARFIEFGTKGSTVEAERAKVLSGAGGTFGTRANIPARPARPFMQPTWDAKKPEVVSRVERAINKAIAEAQKL